MPPFWNVWNTLDVFVISRHTLNPTNSKNASPMPLRICLPCQTHRKPSFQKNNGTGHRNSGNADGDRQKLNGREYFQDLCTALTVVAGSILPPAKTLTAARTATSVPDIKAAEEPVPSIISGKISCVKSYWSIFVP